jgi:hypothetical protein
MIIIMASPDDAQAIMDLQRLAYRSEAELYGDDKLPPLTETVDQIRAEFKTSGTTCPGRDGWWVPLSRSHPLPDR